MIVEKKGFVMGPFSPGPSTPSTGHADCWRTPEVSLECLHEDQWPPASSQWWGFV